LCERASAKPTYGRIEPAASGIVGREDFRGWPIAFEQRWSVWGGAFGG